MVIGFDKVKSVRKHTSNPQYRNKKNDGMSFLLVEIIGFEPMTPCLQGRCSSQLSHTPKFDALLYYQTKAMLSIKFAKFFYYIIVLLKLKTFVQQKKTPRRLFYLSGLTLYEPRQTQTRSNSHQINPKPMKWSKNLHKNTFVLWQ